MATEGRNPNAQVCKPEILLYREGKPKISVILTDWGVRDSFHSLHYLSRQTAQRNDYELIWLEFYDRKPEALARLVADDDRLLDKWIVLGYPDDVLYHKHRLYNVGLMAATGEVCVICDSEAIYQPTFIASLIREFETSPRGIVHIDMVRNNEPRFYPFSYPTIDEVLGPGCVNGSGTPLHRLPGGRRGLCAADYGACLAARRRDLLKIGGADEHVDYLGAVGGPCDMTFRLINYHGRPERWLRGERLYRVWHPTTSRSSAAFGGAHDGHGLALRALNARASFRVKPYVKSPVLGSLGMKHAGLERVLEFLREREDNDWKHANPKPPGDVYLVERDYQSCNVFYHEGGWYALSLSEGMLDPRRARQGDYRTLLKANTLDNLLAELDARDYAGEDSGRDAGLLGRLRRRFFAQPLRRLPTRVWRKSRRLLASWT